MELPDTTDNDSFSWHDLQGTESWHDFTPVTSGITAVGATSYSGRWRDLGRGIQFQLQLSAATSIATVAGTSYVALPITPAKGLAGMAVMTNNTALTAVGVCHVNVATGRVYLPAQAASGNVFTVAGWYEV